MVSTGAILSKHLFKPIKTTKRFFGRLISKMVLNFVFAVSVIWSFLPSTIMVRAVTREYYIAAVIKEWNYAPSGQNQIKGVALQDDRYAKSVLCRKQLLLLPSLGLL